MSLKNNGVPTAEELKKVQPSKESLSKGPVVMMECFQNIPCDPCSACCPSGAIKLFEDINDLPEVDYKKCTGCGICISYCPGLAIFVIDINHNEHEALIKLPYELLPLPKQGQIVAGLDRAGTKVANVRVKKVLKHKNKTNVISILVPKHLAMVIRNIKVEDKKNG